jgi:hypothetical protein
MSPTDIERDVPPVGEELHIPGPSIQPAIATFGLVLLLLGLVDKWPVAILGLLILLGASVSWIAAAAREFRELPPGH